LRIYLSGPLFSQAERRWNRELAAALEERIAGADVILPQDFKPGGTYNSRAFFRELFAECVDGVRTADVVVAVVDGPDVDSGTAFEMGVAHECGIPVVGLRTDFRESQDRGVNLVIAGACTTMLRAMSFGEDMDQLAKDLAGKIVAALKQARRE
jgi:nucleoside 2-deoxyribosyltransferase